MDLPSDPSSADPAPGVPRASRAVSVLLALLLLWSFGLRLWDGAQAPNSGKHYDERFTLRNVTAILRDHTLQPRHAFYLSLSYLPQTAVLAASEGLHKITGIPALSIYGPTADGYSATAYLLCRGLNALFGALSLLIVFRIGSRLDSPWTGLLAAAVLAAFGRHVLSSAEFKPDILVILLVALTFLWSLRVPRCQTLRPYLRAGLGVGLAVSTKYTGIAAALPVAYAGLTEGWRERRRWLWLGLAGLTSIVVFVLLNPFLGLVLEFIPKLVHGYAAKGVEEKSDHLVVFARQISFLIEQHGPIVAAFAGLGTVGLLLRVWKPRPEMSEFQRDGWRLVLSILLGYSIVHGFGMTLFRGQNYLPVAPFSSLAAAWAMVELYRMAARAVPLRSNAAKFACGGIGGMVGLLLLADQSALVYRRAVPSNWAVAESALRRELDPPDLRQVAQEKAPDPLQLQGKETRALNWIVERLDQVGAGTPFASGQLDRLDVEVFPALRLEGPQAAFYRARMDHAAAAPGGRVERVGSHFLRSQGEEWLLLHHPWRLAGEPASLELRNGERPRQIEAPLPAGLAPGTVASLLLWVPRADAGQVGQLLVDPGATPLALFDAGRRRKRFNLVSPRFLVPAGATQVRFVAAHRPESLEGYGATLLIWEPAPAESPDPASKPEP